MGHISTPVQDTRGHAAARAILFNLAVRLRWAKQEMRNAKSYPETVRCAAAHAEAHNSYEVAKRLYRSVLGGLDPWDSV